MKGYNEQKNLRKTTKMKDFFQASAEHPEHPPVTDRRKPQATLPQVSAKTNETNKDPAKQMGKSNEPKPQMKK